MVLLVGGELSTRHVPLIRGIPIDQTVKRILDSLLGSARYLVFKKHAENKKLAGNGKKQTGRAKGLIGLPCGDFMLRQSLGQPSHV